MKLIKNLLLSVALANSVLGQCNPLSATTCDPDPALATSFDEDFHSESKHFDVLNSKGLSYTDDGLKLSLKDRFDNPSIKSNFYIMFGKIEVVLKAASGQGIVSSFYLQSDDLDEIDIELFGGDSYQVQSNFFSKGDTTSYSRGGYHSTPESPIDNYLTYTLDWSKDSLSWAVNGNVVRTLYPNDPQGYPQTPMQIYAGVWAGGDASNPQGTIDWAGGPTTYGPTYSMYIKSLIVTDYSTGSKYEYSDQSGSWESIDSIGGQVNGRQEQAIKDFQDLSDNTIVGTSTYTSAISSTPGPTATSTSSSSVRSTTTDKTISTEEPTTSAKATQTKDSTTTTSSKVSTTAVAAQTPITVIGSSTVWWTPTQTVWWTPTQTTATVTQTAATKTAATQDDNQETNTTAAANTLVPTTVTSSTLTSSTSNTADSSSAPGVSGSLDENSSSRSYPFLVFLVIPFVALLI